jgi:hypothetical protein
MIATTRGMRGAARLAGWLLIPLTMLGTTPAATEDNDKASTDAGALVEVMTLPGPPSRVTSGHFENNPGCARAKLDIWIARGRHSHLIFTPGESTPGSRQAGERDTANRPVQEIMDADGTTIFVGHEGCRIRIRIDRAE